jgi:hypothetical protein
LFFSCCDSGAALSALSNCNERHGAADPSTTIKYLRRTTCGAAGNGLGAMIKYLRHTKSGAAGNFLGTTIKYLLGATGIGLGTKVKYLQRATSAAAGNGLNTKKNTCGEPRVPAWAPRPSNYDTQRAPLQATALAPRSITCVAQRKAPRATA